MSAETSQVVRALDTLRTLMSKEEVDAHRAVILLRGDVLHHLLAPLQRLDKGRINEDDGSERCMLCGADLTIRGLWDAKEWYERCLPDDHMYESRHVSRWCMP